MKSFKQHLIESVTKQLDEATGFGNSLMRAKSLSGRLNSSEGTPIHNVFKPHSESAHLDELSKVAQEHADIRKTLKDRGYTHMEDKHGNVTEC